MSGRVLLLDRKKMEHLVKRKPRTGESCSNDGQIKGNMYNSQCPCFYRTDICTDGVCVASSSVRTAFKRSKRDNSQSRYRSPAQHDMEQKRVQFTLPPTLKKGSDKEWSSGVQQKKGQGAACTDSNECEDWLCCLRQSNGNSCQLKPLTGQQCRRDGQLKGNLYADYCPCRSGEDMCQSGICVSSAADIASSRRQKRSVQNNRRHY
uniref:Prokineticin domain-containing protein n=1 Tax=Amblyomma maculatum TaxID=34609 RepID=G3MT38_AMBMU